MNSKQRRKLRKELEAGDGISKFLAWMIFDGITPCMYKLRESDQYGGNQAYWFDKLKCNAATITKDHVLKYMGCGVKDAITT